MRRTPLSRGTSRLTRRAALTATKGLERRTWLARSTTPTVRRSKRRKPGEATAETTARATVYARSGGLCERCGHQTATEWHHRKSRGVGGGWHAANGMHCCHECHSWITRNPAESYIKGWMVRSTHNPAEVPVLMWPVGLVWLDDEGGVWPADEQEAAA